MPELNSRQFKGTSRIHNRRTAIRVPALSTIPGPETGIRICIHLPQMFDGMKKTNKNTIEFWSLLAILWNKYEEMNGLLPAKWCAPDGGWYTKPSRHPADAGHLKPSRAQHARILDLTCIERLEYLNKDSIKLYLKQLFVSTVHR